MMQVFVKNFINKCITIDIEKNNTIIDLKQKIEDREGIPKDKFKLSCSNKILQDNFTLQYYNIEKEYTFHILPKFK